MVDTQNTSPRAHYHHGDLKAALVRAGRQMLEEGGLERLSLRGIAARVGVSHTAPKNHFHGLNGLLSAIAADGFVEHVQAMTEGIGPASSAHDRLRVACEGYVQFAQNNPALFRLMFSPALLDPDDPALCEARQDSYGVLVGLAKGLNWVPFDGSTPTPRQTELMLWSMVHGYAHLLISEKVGGVDALPTTAVMPKLDVLAGNRTSDNREE